MAWWVPEQGCTAACARMPRRKRKRCPDCKGWGYLVLYHEVRPDRSTFTKLDPHNNPCKRCSGKGHLEPDRVLAWSEAPLTPNALKLMAEAKQRRKRLKGEE